MNIISILVACLVVILVYVLLAAFTPSPIPLIGAIVVILLALTQGNLR